jgi:Protein of unknown function (DUF1566)
MKKLFLLFLLPLCLGLMGMESCFPGDGYTDPSFGTIGHGPALSYTENGNGTFTDDITKFIWEEKTGTPGSSVDCTDATVCADPHNVNNRYTWTDTGDGDSTDPDGTLFTVFIPQLNDACDGDPTITCSSDLDCGTDGPCGFPGHRDWCVPNVKRLQSIVDYSMSNPASSVPGETAASFYWSSTTFASGTNGAWFVNFGDGDVSLTSKLGSLFARAVRPCS